MGSRTDWLTEFAKPVADELAARMGSQKRILSAGVLALADMTPDQREYYMAKAVGQDTKESDSPKPIPFAECAAIVKQFVRYKIPTPEEQQIIDSLRQILADDNVVREDAEKQRRKNHLRKSSKSG